MARYLPDLGNSQITLWSYKEGLLSRVAHDLAIQPSDWSAPLDLLEGDAFRVEVTVSVRGLRVQGQVKNGDVTPLKASDHAEIERNIVGSKGLDAGRSPDVRYVGEGTRAAAGETRVDGTLTLAGTARPLPLRVRITDQGDGFRVEGEVRFLQSAFGIKPFSAMLGALKVKDGVRVSWSLTYRPQ